MHHELILALCVVILTLTCTYHRVVLKWVFKTNSASVLKVIVLMVVVHTWIMAVFFGFMSLINILVLGN